MGQLAQKRWRENTAFRWNIYGSPLFWLYEFWQWWHIKVTLPQTKDVMCCYLLWLGEVKQSAWSHNISLLKALLLFLSNMKDISVLFSILILCGVFFVLKSFFNRFFFHFCHLISCQQHELALFVLCHLLSYTLWSLYVIHSERLMAISAQPHWCDEPIIYAMIIQSTYTLRVDIPCTKTGT